MEPESLRGAAISLLGTAWPMPVSEGTLQWTAVGDHDVWRVRHPSGRTAIVKRTPDPRAATAILIRLAGSATAPTLLAADDRHGIVVLEDVGATTLSPS